MKRLVFVLLITAGALPSFAQIKVGTALPEISLPNVNDSVINLSSFKGKVVLVDFWASWCGPCRATNPSVVKLYNKYKDRGFEVFGVSIDDKKNAWIKAIKQDRIKYTQVNDTGGWYSKVAVAFKIEAIPASFLLDKQGNVVAIDAEGKELDKLVNDLLK
jgi:thiol-disulfide isomerase/thioredoxin